MNKRIIEESVRSLVGDAFFKFDERQNKPNSCAIGVREDLEGSKWAGMWTEKIRSAVRSAVPSAECICVMPIPKDGTVWYTVDVA